MWGYTPVRTTGVLVVMFAALRSALPDTLLRKLQSVQNATARLITGTRRRDVIISRRHYANFIGCPSESTSSSKWHAWFTIRCPDRLLCTWQMTPASCPTALGPVCGQLMFRLAWCREHSAVTATEVLHRRGTSPVELFRSSYAI